MITRMSTTTASARGRRLLATALLVFGSMLSIAHARAILGVDLGSLYMKVALVQSGSPLEIVTNLHSKRKTEQMVLFDNNQRFYGADAAALLARKAQKTPAGFSILLGRDDQHPVVRVLAERHYPVTPVYNETRSGVVLNVDGHSFTPEELVAMVLSHAVDISVAYSAESGSPLATVKDVVLTTPMFATVAERRALLDAATLAELNVLTIVDENTAAALHYAMDKQFETPQLLLFYNLGASALQVSLIRFFNYELPQKFGKPKTVPGFEILAKAWDETLGGNAFDHVIVDKLLAEPFNAAWWASKPEHAGKDVRDVPRAMTKFRLQANKIKHVLSANNDIPVHMDSVHDDVSLSLTITREQFEKHADALFERALQPIAKVLAMANCTIANLTGTELVGGGMRIPKVQQKLQEYLGENLELGLHINADESFALGAAFAGANISTAFRVRHVGMTDINPFSMKVSLENLKTDDEKTSTYDEEKNAWAKQAVIFKENGKLGVKKTIAFTHDRDVHCGLDYVESIDLPTGTELGLSRYNITGVAEFAAEMKEKGLGIPKVSLQFELSASGIPNLVRAEAAVEETYTVQEEVEVEDDGSDTDNSTDAIVDKSDATEETDTSEDKKEESDEKTNETDSSSNLSANETDSVEKPKKKRIMVEKEKKKLHKKPLVVKTYYVGKVQPHSPELLQASKDKLLEMAQRDKERMMLEESKNKLESYIYRVKNKLEDDEKAIEAVTDKKQREEIQKFVGTAEHWLEEEGYHADLATTEDKYAELAGPFEKIMLRISESTARPEAIESLGKKLTDVEGLMVKWEESKPQVTKEERDSVLAEVENVRKWIEDMEKAQAKKKPHEEPAFLSKDVIPQLKPIKQLVEKLNRKPKPKPEPKNETSADSNATSTTKDDGSENATIAADGDDTTTNTTSTTEEGSTPQNDNDIPSADSTEEDSTTTSSTSTKEEDVSESKDSEEPAAQDAPGVEEEL